MRGQLVQAAAQCRRAQARRAFDDAFRLALGQGGEHLVIEHEPVAAHPSTVGQHMEIGGFAGPGEEIRARLEFAGLPPQGKVGLLQDVLRGRMLRVQGEHVGPERRLGGREFPDEPFPILVHRRHHQVMTTDPGI